MRRRLPTSRRSGEFLQEKRGATLLTVGLAVTVLMGIAAFGVDTGYLFLTKNMLQLAADAEALAAIRALPETDTMRTRAREIAALNMAVSEHGNVLVDDDVVIGTWNSSTRQFTAG